MSAALNLLKSSHKTRQQLITLVAQTDGEEGAAKCSRELDKLIALGWVCHSVLALATAIPIVEEDYRFNYPTTEALQGKVTLSRFAYLHQCQGETILDVPSLKLK